MRGKLLTMELREGVSFIGCQAVFVDYFSVEDPCQGYGGLVSTQFVISRGSKKSPGNARDRSGRLVPDRSAAYSARTIINWTGESGCPKVWFIGPFTLDVAGSIHRGRDTGIADANTSFRPSALVSECCFTHPGSRL